MQTIPTTARFYITKNFYNDINGNPRRFFELYDSEMNYLGYCKDNYAGENFCVGRNLKRVGNFLSRGGYRNYISLQKKDVEFKNEVLYA